eukprot:SAG31_NODE_885_length_11254_cov_14.613088_6_plen_187_part_00
MLQGSPPAFSLFESISFALGWAGPGGGLEVLHSLLLTGTAVDAAADADQVAESAGGTNTAGDTAPGQQPDTTAGQSDIIQKMDQQIEIQKQTNKFLKNLSAANQFDDSALFNDKILELTKEEEALVSTFQFKFYNQKKDNGCYDKVLKREATSCKHGDYVAAFKPFYIEHCTGGVASDAKRCQHWS